MSKNEEYDRMNEDARTPARDGNCQAWVLRPDGGTPAGLIIVAIAVVVFVIAPRIVQPGTYYPLWAMILFALPAIAIIAFVHEMLFAKHLVRVGRDGVFQPRWLGRSFVGWACIREVDVTREGLGVALRDGGRLKLRFARAPTWAEEEELRRRIPILRAGSLQAHPLALRHGEAPDAWLARIKKAPFAPPAYRHAANEQEELFACARDRDLCWTARLAALIRLHLADADGLRDLQERISDEYAAVPVVTAFRVADLGDGPLLSSCKDALKIGALASSEHADS